MDVTYREIQEINDQLRDLQEQEHYSWQHIKSLSNASDKALKENNIAEYKEITANNPGASYRHSTLQNEIRDLRTRKQALWEQHNEAKTQWRRLRGR